MASGDAQLTVRALVDTGSPFCVFGRAVADALDVNMAPAPERDRTVHLLGKEHRGRRAMVRMNLAPFDGLSWEAEVVFLHGDFDVSYLGLLGQEGFLDRWVASFNFYDGYFVIEERDSYVERMPIDVYEVYQQQYDSDWQRPTPQ